MASALLTATVVLLPAGSGRDRILPLGQGAYRPHLRVLGDEEYLGVELIPGSGCLAPGESAELQFRTAYDGVDYSRLTPGTSFEIMEGGTVVGTGTISEHTIANN